MGLHICRKGFQPCYYLFLEDTSAIEPSEEQGPVSLLRGQPLRFLNVPQGSVICQKHKRLICSLQLMPPLLTLGVIAGLSVFITSTFLNGVGGAYKCRAQREKA